ncbi:MAG: histidine kinase [Firmicutes bacterium]|nr:histidine kinase [Bacillota bacterium]NLL87984.1 histidine kinase [Bacillota bacterium]HKM16953.1 ATP-binding protein [Limnochordia bacterium]
MLTELDPKRIEEILFHAVGVLADSKKQMFEIVELAQREFDRISMALAELKQEINATIEEVERLEHDFRLVRIRLAEVSRNFTRYGEAAREVVYRQADRLREALAAVREREKNLQRQRMQQEQALVQISQLVAKAEQSVSQVDIALEFLKGNLEELNEQLANISMRYQLGQRIIKMQEDERKRVAREIHDGPAQDLANVVLKAEICERLFDVDRMDELRLELQELKSTVKFSLDEIRKIIHNLRPMVLDDLGLVPAVKRLIEEVQEQSGLEIGLSVLGPESRLDPAVEIALFRIVQEAINNSRKHANASLVQVKLEFLPEKVSAVVEDNGVGFDKDTLNQRLAGGDHFGLYGMRERIELLGGTFRIRSKKGSGTRVSVTIRLPQKG